MENMTWNQRGKPDVDSIFKYNQISTWKQRQAMTWIQRGFNVIMPARVCIYNVLSIKNTDKRQHAWVCLCNVTK